jgi:hypothetical protein
MNDSTQIASNVRLCDWFFAGANGKRPEVNTVLSVYEVPLGFCPLFTNSPIGSTSSAGSESLSLITSRSCILGHGETSAVGTALSAARHLQDGTILRAS